MGNNLSLVKKGGQQIENRIGLHIVIPAQATWHCRWLISYCSLMVLITLAASKLGNLSSRVSITISLLPLSSFLFCMYCDVGHTMSEKPVIKVELPRKFKDYISIINSRLRQSL